MNVAENAAHTLQLRQREARSREHLAGSRGKARTRRQWLTVHMSHGFGSDGSTPEQVVGKTSYFLFMQMT